MEGGRSSSRLTWERSGFSAKDVDVAQIYDGFSASVIYGLESYGFCKEGEGVASSVLRNLGVDLDKLRDAIVGLICAGPDRVVMGKLPLTPRAKKLEGAIAGRALYDGRLDPAKKPRAVRPGESWDAANGAIYRAGRKPERE